MTEALGYRCKFLEAVMSEAFGWLVSLDIALYLLPFISPTFFYFHPDSSRWFYYSATLYFVCA